MRTSQQFHQTPASPRRKPGCLMSLTRKSSLACAAGWYGWLCLFAACFLGIRLTADEPADTAARTPADAIATSNAESFELEELKPPKDEDTVNMPDIAGKWTMRNWRIDGPQQNEPVIIRRSAKSPRELELVPNQDPPAEGQKEFAIPVAWTTGTRRFTAKYTSDYTTQNYTFQAGAGNQSLRVTIDIDDKTRKAFIERGMSETQIDERLNQVWMRDAGPLPKVVAESPSQEPPATKKQTAEMPDIAGFWYWMIKGQAVPIKVKIVAAAPDATHQFRLESQVEAPRQLTWLNEYRVFEMKSVEGAKAEYWSLIRAAADGKKLFVFNVTNEESREVLAQRLIKFEKNVKFLTENSTTIATRIEPFSRMQGEDYFVIETRDGLDAFSESAGIWDRIAAPLPEDGFPRMTEMTIGKRLAIVKIRDRILVYNRLSGRWSTFQVPENSKAEIVVGVDFLAAQVGDQLLGFSAKADKGSLLANPEVAGTRAAPTIGQNLLTAQLGDKVYALSSKTGQWTLPEAKVDFTASDASSSSPDDVLSKLSGNWQMMTRRRSNVRQILQVDNDWYLAEKNGREVFQPPIKKWQLDVVKFPIKWQPDEKAFRVELPLVNQELIPYRMIYSAKDDKITLVPIMDESVHKKIATEVNLPDESPARLEKDYTEEMSRNVPDRISGTDCLIVETKDGLDGYSQVRGTWDRVKIGMPKDGFPRISDMTVSEHFATGVIDDQLLGFSSEAGKWGRLTIPPEHIGNVKVEHGKIITARVGDQTYALSPQTGQWTMPDGKPEVASADRQIKVFPLANSDAGESARLIKDLFPAASAVSDARTNTVIVTSDEEELGRIEAVLLRLDEPSNPAAVPIRKGLGFLTRRRIPDSPAAQRLANEIARHETDAVELAKQIRNRSINVGNNHPDQVEGRTRLQNALAAALELKFQLEQLQVEELRTRLSQLEQQIGQRKALQQKIIDRRAEELIEGDATRWDNEESRVGRGSASPTDSAPSPVGLEDSSHPTTPTVKSKAPEEVVTRSDSEHSGTSPIEPNKMRVTLEIERSYSHLFALDCDGSEHTWPATLQLDHDPQRIRSYPLHLVGQWPVPSKLLLGTLEIHPHKDADVDPLHVVFQITADDFNQVNAGKDVLRVFYVTEAKPQELAVRRIEMLSSTRLDPNLDPLAEADKRGTILAVLRLSARPQSAGEPDADSKRTSSAPRSNATSMLPIPSYQDLVARLEQARDGVESAKRILAKMDQKNLPNIEQGEKALEQAVRTQGALHQEYHALIRELELLAESGQLAVADAQAKFDRAEKLFEKRVMTEQERNEIERNLKQAQLTLQRLQNQLELYRRAGEEYGVLPPKLSKTIHSDQDGTNDVAATEKLAWDRLGLKLRPLNPSEWKLALPKYRGGLMVTQVKAESPAAAGGIRENDILVGLEKWETVNLQNVAFVLAQTKNDPVLKFYVLRGEEVMTGELRSQGVE